MNIDIKAFIPYLSITCLFFVIAGSYRCFKYGGKKKAPGYIPIVLLLIMYIHKFHAASPQKSKYLKMIFLFFFIVCFFVNCSRCNSPEQEEKPLKRLWLTFLGGEGPDSGFSMTIDPTGSIYIAGSSEVDWWNDSTKQTWSQPGGGFITRMDINGNMINTIPLHSITCYDFTFDQEGNFCIMGHGGETLKNPIREQAHADILLASMDKSGNVLWHTYMGSEKYQDTGNDIAVSQNGDIFVVGRSELGWGEPLHAFNGFYDALVAKFDANGNRLWHTFLGSAYADEACAVNTSPDGFIFVAGNSIGSWGNPINPHSGNDDGFIAKMDSAGNILWNTFIDFGAGESCKVITLDKTGDIIVAGTSETWALVDKQQKWIGDVFIARFSRDGNLLWKQSYGSEDDDRCKDIAIDENNNIYMIGDTHAEWKNSLNSISGQSDTFLAKFNNQGSLEWTFFMGSDYIDLSDKLAIHSSGSIILTGLSLKSWGYPLRDYSGSGDIFVTSISVQTNKNLLY